MRAALQAERSLEPSVDATIRSDGTGEAVTKRLLWSGLSALITNDALILGLRPRLIWGAPLAL